MLVLTAILFRVFGSLGSSWRVNTSSCRVENGVFFGDPRRRSWRFCDRSELKSFIYLAEDASHFFRHTLRVRGSTIRGWGAQESFVASEGSSEPIVDAVIIPLLPSSCGGVRRWTEASHLTEAFSPRPVVIPLER